MVQQKENKRQKETYDQSADGQSRRALHVRLALRQQLIFIVVHVLKNVVGISGGCDNAAGDQCLGFQGRIAILFEVNRFFHQLNALLVEILQFLEKRLLLRIVRGKVADGGDNAS